MGKVFAQKSFATIVQRANGDDVGWLGESNATTSQLFLSKHGSKVYFLQNCRNEIWIEVIPTLPRVGSFLKGFVVSKIPCLAYLLVNLGVQTNWGYWLIRSIGTLCLNGVECASFTYLLVALCINADWGCWLEDFLEMDATDLYSLLKLAMIPYFKVVSSSFQAVLQFSFKINSFHVLKVLQLVNTIHHAHQHPATPWQYFSTFWKLSRNPTFFLSIPHVHISPDFHHLKNLFAREKKSKVAARIFWQSLWGDSSPIYRLLLTQLLASAFTSV